MTVDNSEHVVIVGYDSRWPTIFEATALWLRETLGSDLVLRVEHFGSTAIPGMPAKPVIDMLVEIPSFERALPEAVLKLEAEGWSYIWRADRPPGHMMFIKGLPPHGSRTHHVHMAPHDHKLWERLDFRDYLIKHPNEAQKYACLKRELAEKFARDREAYTNAKGEYIQMVTQRALRHTRAT